MTDKEPEKDPAKEPDAAPAAAKRYRRIYLYDAQRQAETGIGKFTLTRTESHYGPGELDAEVARIRKAQAEKNRDYHKLKHSDNVDAIMSLDNVRLPPRPPLPGVTYEDSIVLKLDEGTGNSTVLLGSSKAGKSTAMMEIFREYYAGKDYITTLFSCSPQAPVYRAAEHGISKAKAARLVNVTGYDPRLIRMAKAINRGTDNQYPFCFLIDDIINQRDDKTLAELILTYRNSYISSVVCLQYSNLLAKMSRANVNNVLLFRFNSDEAIELVVSQWLRSHFRKLGVPAERMTEFYKQVTDDHGFIYLHTATDSMTFHRLQR